MLTVEQIDLVRMKQRIIFIVNVVPRNLPFDPLHCLVVGLFCTAWNFKPMGAAHISS